MTLSAELAAKIRSGRIVIGTWLNIPHHAVVETIAQSDFDLLLMDGEHSPFHPDMLSGLLTAAELRRRPVVYRVRANREDLIKGALDAGVSGIMVPMVNSREDAERAVSAARYPPEGKRGIGPWRASNFYTDFSSYLETANAATILILQIESKEAVANIDEIAAVPNADALFVGPADLAASMGLPVGHPHPDLLDACGRISSAAKKAGKVAGIDIGSLDDLPKYRALGYSLFTYGLDTSYLIDGARAAAEAIRKKVLKTE